MAMTQMDFMNVGGGGMEEMLNDTLSATVNTWLSTGIQTNGKRTIVMFYSTSTVGGNPNAEGVLNFSIFENDVKVASGAGSSDCRINNGIVEIERTYRSGYLRTFIYQ